MQSVSHTSDIDNFLSNNFIREVQNHSLTILSRPKTQVKKKKTKNKLKKSRSNLECRKQIKKTERKISCCEDINCKLQESTQGELRVLGSNPYLVQRRKKKKKRLVVGG